MRVGAKAFLFYFSLGMIRINRIMLMNTKHTMMSMAHSSQFTDFCACCSSLSDSSFSFSRFWSAILSECDSVCGRIRDCVNRTEAQV